MRIAFLMGMRQLSFVLMMSLAKDATTIFLIVPYIIPIHFLCVKARTHDARPQEASLFFTSFSVF